MPLPGDAHPSSGACRVVTHLIFHEINRVAETAQLPALDETDERRYLPAIKPLVEAVKARWSSQNPLPCRDEVEQVRASIREFDRWRRKPTGLELRDIIRDALGLLALTEMLTGAQEAERTVLGAPQEFRQRQEESRQSQPEPPAQDEAPKLRQDDLPEWLPAFARAVGHNELKQKTFLIPLLQIKDKEAIYRAIAAIEQGNTVDRNKRQAERLVEQAQRQRKKERTSYVGSCLTSIRQILNAGAEAELRQAREKNQ